MLRKASLIAVDAALAIPGYGAVIRSEAYDLRLDMQSGVDADAYAFPPASVSLGYFPADNFEVGGLMGLRNANWDSFWVTGNVWELGIFAEYHFDVNFNFHPLVGVRGSLLDGEKDSDTVYQAFIYGGGKVFLSENVAIVIDAGVAFAGDKIYNVDTKLNQDLTKSQSGDSVGFLADVGIRYFF